MRSNNWYDMLNWPLSSWLVFVVGLVGVIVLIYLIVRLVARVNEDSDPAEADREMLLTLSDLRREGDLTHEEFRSIKSRLVQRLMTTDGHFQGATQPADSAEFTGDSQARNVTQKSESSDNLHDNKNTTRGPVNLSDQITDHSDSQKRDTEES